MSEGHIRPRGKGSWEIKYDIGRNPLTGERQIKYQTVHGTKRDAQRELRRQLTAVDTGQFTDSRKLTLGEYLVWWLENEAQNKVAPKTLQVYRYMADKHIVPALGACPLSQLRPHHITEYYNKKLQAGRLDGKGGLSPQSIRHHDRLLNVALKRARALNIIPRNPVEDVSRPTVPDREIQTLNDQQLATLLTAAAGTRLYQPVFMALTTGLRRGGDSGSAVERSGLEPGHGHGATIAGTDETRPEVQGSEDPVGPAYRDAPRHSCGGPKGAQAPPGRRAHGPGARQAGDGVHGH